jgi:hypothetical protein
LVYVGVSGPECRPKSGLKIGNRSFENVSVQVFGNDSNKSKVDSGGNQEEVEDQEPLVLACCQKM